MDSQHSDSFWKIPFMLTLTQPIMDKKTDKTYKRQKLRHFPQSRGQTHLRHPRHLLHLPAPNSTLQHPGSRVPPSPQKMRGRGDTNEATRQVTATLALPDPNLLPVNNLGHIMEMLSSLSTLTRLHSSQQKLT